MIQNMLSIRNGYPASSTISVINRDQAMKRHTTATTGKIFTRGVCACRQLLPVRTRLEPGVIARAFGGGGDMNTTFLSLEEAGLVDFAPIDMHEKFLARLTVSSLNLLKVIAKEEDCTIEELNAGRIADWFTKDNERRQTDPDDAVLKW
mmetsp:Transcript_40816/g.76388  ORF Transcript_40816/g.76388 Transcript_40816/m.76388 type:complete len:149 (-) Transcript_40816:527-973(-)